MSSSKKSKEEDSIDLKLKKSKTDDNDQSDNKKRQMFKSGRSSSTRSLTAQKIEPKEFSKDDLKTHQDEVKVDKPEKLDKKKLKRTPSSSNVKAKAIKPQKENKTKEEVKVKHKKRFSSSDSNKDDLSASEDKPKSVNEDFQMKVSMLKNIPLTLSSSHPFLSKSDKPSDSTEEKTSSEDQDLVKDIPEELILSEIPLSPHKRGIDSTKQSPRATYVIASPRDDKINYNKDSSAPLSPMAKKIGRVRSFTDVLGDPKNVDNFSKESSKSQQEIPELSPPTTPQPIAPPAPPPLPGQTVIVNAKSIDLISQDNVIKVTERKQFKQIEDEYKKWDSKSSDFEKRLYELRLDRSNNIQGMFDFPENDIIIELLESDLCHYPPIDESAPLSIKDSHNYFTLKKINIRMQSEWYGGVTSHKDRVKDFEIRSRNANTTSTNNENVKDQTNINIKPKSLKMDTKKTQTKNVQKKRTRIMSSSDRVDRSNNSDLDIGKIDESDTEVSEVSETESSEQSESMIKIQRSNSFNKRNRSPKPTREKSDVRTPLIVSKSDRPRSLSVSSSESPAFNLQSSYLLCDEKQRKKEADKRDNERKDLFQCFAPPSISSEPNDEVQDLKSPIDHVGAKVLFHFKTLKINVGFEEPFWFSATFYDISKQCRLTETFYFDYNSENDLIKTIVEQHSGASDPETQAKRFIPSFPYANEHIYLVIRVSTGIRGDVDSISEPYSQGGSMSAKDRDRKSVV